MEKVSCLNLPNCLKLSNGQVEVVVTTDIGPRIIRYAFVGGENILGEMRRQAWREGVAGLGRPSPVDCAGGPAEELRPRQRPDQARSRRAARHSAHAAGRARHRDREGDGRHARRDRQRRHRAASPHQSQQGRVRAGAVGAHHHERRRHGHRAAGAVQEAPGRAAAGARAGVVALHRSLRSALQDRAEVHPPLDQRRRCRSRRRSA